MKNFILSYIFIVSSFINCSFSEEGWLDAHKHESLKRSYLKKTEHILFKNKMKVIGELSIISSFVFAFRYELISRAIPSLKKGSSSLFAVPGEGFLINATNFFLENAQMMLASYCMGMMYQRLTEFIQPGKWKFNLISFMQRHTQLYESFEYLSGEIKGLLYQNDPDIRILIVDMIAVKMNKLIAELYYIDGYTLLKIKEYHTNGRFHAKANLTKEYEAFEVIRNQFIMQFCNVLREIKTNTLEEQYHSKVFDLLHTLQTSSQHIQQRLASLNLYE